jgi:hypothetical protein
LEPTSIIHLQCDGALISAEVSCRRTLGGFNWSSQHLDEKGCDGCTEAAFGPVFAVMPTAVGFDRSCWWVPGRSVSAETVKAEARWYKSAVGLDADQRHNTLNIRILPEYGICAD